MHRRVATVLLLGMLTAVLVGVVATPAAAEITRGDCRGSATFPDKTTDAVLDAARPRSEIFEAPLSATVGYSGDLGPSAEPSDKEISFRGGVVIRLPRVSWQIVGWSGDTKEVGDSGAYTYDLPSFTPQGTGGMQVTAWHIHDGVADCEAIVTVSIAGSPGGVAVAAAALTVLAGAGTLAAGRRRP
ncbi:MAG: hypothetical protein BMS9Abin07_1873 [Acidimicrobiia bacterium]|nr:MAG: hypothetical protein BMS9Abin07_1873 [Acidimicrobiia bacterium]